MRKIFFAASLFLAASPSFVLAQGIKDAQKQLTPIVQKAGLSDQGSLENVVGTIVNAALSLVGLIFLVLMVYAGFTWMLAQGDEGKIDKSKEIIKACIIGLIITASAYAITFFVTARFEKSTTDSAATSGTGSNSGSGTVFCLENDVNGNPAICTPTSGSTPVKGTCYSTISECEAAAK